MLAGLSPMCGFVQGGMGGGLFATVSDDAVSKTASTYNTAKVVTSNSVTVTVTGGSGSYTHAWTSSDAIDSTATAPSAATTAFASLLEPGADEIARWVDTVTDTVTGLQFTVEVEVTLTLVSYL